MALRSALSGITRDETTNKNLRNSANKKKRRLAVRKKQLKQKLRGLKKKPQQLHRNHLPKARNPQQKIQSPKKSLAQVSPALTAEPLANPVQKLPMNSNKNKKRHSTVTTIANKIGNSIVLKE